MKLALNDKAKGFHDSQGKNFEFYFFWKLDLCVIVD